MGFETAGLSRAYNAAQEEAVRLKEYAQNHRAGLIANAQTGLFIEQIMLRMPQAVAIWDAAKNLPGMLQYAKDQHDDPTYDVVLEFTSMRSAAIAVSQWIFDNFPKSSGGFIEKERYETDFSITAAMFTPAQTSGLQTALLGLMNTIETP